MDKTIHLQNLEGISLHIFQRSLFHLSTSNSRITRFSCVLNDNGGFRKKVTLLFTFTHSNIILII